MKQMTQRSFKKLHRRSPILVALFMHGILAVMLFYKMFIVSRQQRTDPSQKISLAGAWPKAYDVSRVLVVVLTGEVYHATRLRTLLDTWGRWVPRHNLLIVSDKAEASLGAMEAPGTLGGYESSQAKWYYAVLMAGEKLRSNRVLEWVCVVDDDTFLFVPNLLRLLASLDNTKRAYYGEICGPTECGGPCVCGGGGWVTPSHFFVEMAAAFAEYGSWPPPCCNGTIYSDLIISQWMNEVAKVPITFRKEFKSYPPDFYLRPELSDHILHPDRHRSHMRLGAKGWGNVVTFHYVGTGQFGTSSAVDAKLLYSLSRAFFGNVKENEDYSNG